MLKHLSRRGYLVRLAAKVDEISFSLVGFVLSLVGLLETPLEFNALLRLSHAGLRRHSSINLDFVFERLVFHDAEEARLGLTVQVRKVGR